MRLSAGCAVASTCDALASPRVSAPVALLMDLNSRAEALIADFLIFISAKLWRYGGDYNYAISENVDRLTSVTLMLAADLVSGDRFILPDKFDDADLILCGSTRNQFHFQRSFLILPCMYRLWFTRAPIVH